MKKRGIVFMVLMYMFTFGIYPLYWYCSFQNQLHKETGMGFGGVGHFFMSLITFGIYPIYWHYAVGKRLQALGGANHGGLYLVLTIFGLFVIAEFLMQSEANNLPERVEAPVEAPVEA